MVNSSICVAMHESIGLPPGTITDPDYSIQVGVNHFAEVMKQAKGDVNLALQSYNCVTRS